jgi:DNA (cytosine-5)-methyltransferase 1
MINIQNKSLTGFKFRDLFAGIGGFHLALSSLGAECVYANEWDSFAQKVYEENFGIKPEGDITQVNENLIPNHDILCAGFPCQAFSISGKQRGFEDSRGTLFFDVARVVKAKRPKVVFMENVKNFATHDDGNTLAVVQNTMLELGYTFNKKVLNAVNYEMPQKRERIYMICFRNNVVNKEFNYPKQFKLEKHVEDFLLKDESLVKDLFVNRTDTFYNGQEDNKYSNTTIRLGIVNKVGKVNVSIVLKVLLLLYLLMVVVYLLKQVAI